MSVDVKAEVVINRSRDEVARFAMNPDNDPVWIGGIREARMLTEPPLAQGTQVERVATFLGKRIEYVLQVAEYEPKALLAMRSVKALSKLRIVVQGVSAALGHISEDKVRALSLGMLIVAVSFVFAIACGKSDDDGCVIVPDGTYEGQIHNKTHGVTSDISATLDQTVCQLNGVLTLEPQLIGSGNIRGNIHGNEVLFLVLGESNEGEVELVFKGKISENTLSGTYRVREGNETGDWNLAPGP